MEDIKKISEQILRILSGGDPAIETKVEISEIERLVKLTAADVGFNEWVNNKKLEFNSNPNSSWLYEYNVSLSNGAITSEKIGLLPSAYLRLPGDKGFFGVHYIADNKRERIPYIPYSVFINQRSSSQSALGDLLYTLKAGQMIIFDGCFDRQVPLTSVIITLAVANEETIDDVRGLEIIQKVVPILQLQMRQKTDMVTDNNPTP
jgi:hypothetical protein